MLGGSAGLSPSAPTRPYAVAPSPLSTLPFVAVGPRAPPSAAESPVTLQ